MGYYRTRYDGDALQKLTAVATTELSTAERLSLLNDEGALVLSGQENVANYLNLISALNQDDERAIVESYLAGLRLVHDDLLTEASKPAFLAWVRSNFSPMFAKLGWTPVAGETDDRHEVRALLIQILGEIGEDPEVINHAVALAGQYSKDETAIDPSLVRGVLEVAAMSNDAGLFQQYMEAMSNPKSSPEQLSDYSRGLDRFSDPKLTEQWLERIIGPETRSQDAAGYLGRVLQNPSAQKMAWEWTKQHWSEVAGKLTTGSGFAIVNATSHFCSANMRNEVEQFFSDHKVAATSRSLKQSMEMMDSCIHFQARQQPNLTAWLEQHASNASAGAR